MILDCIRQGRHAQQVAGFGACGDERMVKLAQQFPRDGIRDDGVPVFLDVLAQRIKHN